MAALVAASNRGNHTSNENLLISGLPNSLHKIAAVKQ